MAQTRSEPITTREPLDELTLARARRGDELRVRGVEALKEGESLGETALPLPATGLAAKSSAHSGVLVLKVKAWIGPFISSARGVEDHAVLRDAGLAREGLRDDYRFPVVLGAGEILDLDLGVGNRFADAGDDGVWLHGPGLSQGPG